MSNCCVNRTIRLPIMLAILALFLGACSLETEMQPAEKLQNASSGQSNESKRTIAVACTG